MKKYIILFLVFLVCCHAQAQETIARFKYEDAEKAFMAGNYQECIDNLDEAEKLLGKTAPNILHLKIVAQHKLFENNPFESYEALETLRNNCNTYLANYDIAGLEEKYRDVYDVVSTLPMDKDAYQSLQQKHDAEQSLARQKIKETQKQVDTLMPMVIVKGGEIRLGGKSFNPLYVLTDYQIGKYEVTQKLWQYVMGTNPSKYECTNCPVTNVSWYDVQDFIGKLNKMTERNYGLPSEAQWEYAAKGGKESKGYIYSGSNSSKKVAWYTSQVTWSDGKKRPYEVGTKEPNELGIHDMSGNVNEWCHDWNGSLIKTGDKVIDPMGPESGEEKVRRGGSYASTNLYCEVNWRYNTYAKPNERFSTVGFRLVLTLNNNVLE